MVSLTVDALAAFRLTRLVQDDTLPPLPRLRAYVYKRTETDHPARELLSCPWCLGFWLAAGATIARRVVPRAWDPLARALAAGAVVGAAAETVRTLEAVRKR